MKENEYLAGGLCMVLKCVSGQLGMELLQEGIIDG